jgi:hypothetical protein
MRDCTIDKNIMKEGEVIKPIHLSWAAFLDAQTTLKAFLGTTYAFILEQV